MQSAVLLSQRAAAAAAAPEQQPWQKPAMKEFPRPAKVYDQAGNDINACVSLDGQEFCSYFGPSADGGITCVVSGKITPGSQIFETAGALVFCDSKTPGCGPRPQSLYCLGTAEPCLPQGIICPNECLPTNYFMNCPVGPVS
jgi:hypothetical protein